MRRILPIAILLVLVSGCAADDDTESMTVGSAVAAVQVGDEVRMHGEVSLLGDLFCPCFHLSDGEGTVVVWYDLMVDEGGEFTAVDVAGLENGGEVTVTGEYRSNDPGTGYPVVWATAIEPR